MANYPTIAIFFSRHDPQKKKRGKLPGQAVRKSIFDVKDHTSLHCLAAVNYTRPLQGNDTVVLWLATTLKAPPKESTHVTWRNLGLASYLLCMLVKQHTVNDWDWKYCALYLQASRQRDNPARRFYLKMGFQCHDYDDNGYEKLPYQFRLQVCLLSES
jgi:GNAT superfamily N-acetyltransferase